MRAIAEAEAHVHREEVGRGDSEARIVAEQELRPRT
jgi:hypothetical protein